MSVEMALTYMKNIYNGDLDELLRTSLFFNPLIYGKSLFKSSKVLRPRGQKLPDPSADISTMSVLAGVKCASPLFSARMVCAVQAGSAARIGRVRTSIPLFVAFRRADPDFHLFLATHLPQHY